MKKFLLSIVLSASVLASPTTNAMAIPDNLAFYISMGGVVVASTLKHISKRISPRLEIDLMWDSASVFCAIAGIVIDRMFVKEQLDAGLQEIKSSLPAILNAGKPNCAKELAECRNKEETCKNAITPINASDQIIALNAGKVKTAKILLENAALKIHLHTSKIPGLTNHNAITKVLIELSMEFLGLYPGFTNKNREFYATPNFRPDSTGASYWYNETLISTTAKSLGFTEFVKQESITKLQEYLDTLSQGGNEGSAKALYMHHFFETLELLIPMPESLTKYEASTQTPDL